MTDFSFNFSILIIFHLKVSVLIKRCTKQGSKMYNFGFIDKILIRNNLYMKVYCAIKNPNSSLNPLIFMMQGGGGRELVRTTFTLRCQLNE